tara:strand:- start:4091 stop:5098 length:1008 start_codon:yes stop_codon:yes gene_type:complete
MVQRKIFEDNLLYEPEREIIDAHHHLWKTGPMAESYELTKFRYDTGTGHNVVGTMFVECGVSYLDTGPDRFKPIGESRFARKNAEKSEIEAGPGKPPILGIVAYADLMQGKAAKDILLAQKEAAGEYFSGIRYATAFHPNPPEGNRRIGQIKHIMLRDTFREGFSQLRDLNISYDAWLLYDQIPELIDLANKFEDIQIVLNHLGGPIGIGLTCVNREAVLSDWKTNLDELSKCENVNVKLGGLCMPITGWAWHERTENVDLQEIYDNQADFYKFVIDLFGPRRCMFESNFPIDRLSISYKTLWNLFKLIGLSYNECEKQYLFSKTCIETYRLKLL